MRFVVGLWSVETPHQDIVDTDVDARIAHLETALRAFKAEVDKHKFGWGQKVKGIFVAPEYFLANKGAAQHDQSQRLVERTISVHERDRCVQIIRGLSLRYADILLVPGTIAWKKTFDRLAGENFQRDKQTQMRTQAVKATPADRRARAASNLNHFINLDQPYSNLTRTKEFSERSLVGRYYETKTVPSDPAKLSMVKGETSISETSEKGGKKTIILPDGSVQYYMRNTAYVYLNGDIVYKYHKKGDFFESINEKHTVFIPSPKEPVKSIEVSPHRRMKFGFEICLDHTIESLKSFIQMADLGIVDFHILSSAAIESDPAKMTMRDGGYFLHASAENKWTSVYHMENNHPKLVQPSAASLPNVAGYPLKFYTITCLDPGDQPYLDAVNRALATYTAEKTVFASKASEHALKVLRELADGLDVHGLRIHLEWYLGVRHAPQPPGAGAPVPRGKRFHTLLAPLLSSAQEHDT